MKHNNAELSQSQTAAIDAVLIEMGNQDEEWGQQEHQPLYWLGICIEEAGALAKEMITIPKGPQDALAIQSRMQNECTQLAAVAVQILAYLYRNNISTQNVCVSGLQQAQLELENFWEEQGIDYCPVIHDYNGGGFDGSRED